MKSINSPIYPKVNNVFIHVKDLKNQLDGIVISLAFLIIVIL